MTRDELLAQLREKCAALDALDADRREVLCPDCGCAILVDESRFAEIRRATLVEQMLQIHEELGV